MNKNNIPTIQENTLDMSVLQFEFDASVLTTHRHRRSHHRRSSTTPPLLASNSGSCPAQSIPPHFASISAKLANTDTKAINNTVTSKNLKDDPSAGKNTAPAGTILPVGLKRGPHPRRYLWDGHRLVAVELSDLESVSSAASALENTTINGNNRKNRNKKGVFVPLPSLEHAVARWLHNTRAAFFPHPDEVTPDYWQWCKFRATHRIFSSMASVFGTQSLLLAVGVGAKRTLPAAAAINWVLKDGLGRLGRLSVATRFGESFDSDLKRFRFSSSLLYATSLALDFLTPLFPQYFLPMASIANVGKSVGLTTYISTQPAFYRSFAISENLADISAKSQAQQMAVDTLGLAFAVTLSALCARHSEAARRALPLVAFPFLVSGDLLAITNELKSIHLRTLNKERAEIIAAEYVATGKVATPEDVSTKERLILPPACSLGVLPLTFGGLEEVLTTGEEVDKFLKNLVNPGKGNGGGKFKNQERRKSVFASGKAKSVLSQEKRYAFKIVLPPSMSSEATLLNKTTSSSKVEQQQQKQETGKKVNMSSSSISYFLDVISDIKTWAGIGRKNRGAVHAALRTDASHEDVLEIILRTAKLRSTSSSSGSSGSGSAVVMNAEEVSTDELKHFVKQLSDAGWQVSPFMLSSAEKKFYCEMT